MSVMADEFTVWRKSSRSSGGACVEVSSWRTSSRCESGACVEIGHGPAGVGVRDTKLAESPVLTFSASAWEAFTGRLKSAPREVRPPH